MTVNLSMSALMSNEEIASDADVDDVKMSWCTICMKLLTDNCAVSSADCCTELSVDNCIKSKENQISELMTIKYDLSDKEWLMMSSLLS